MTYTVSDLIEQVQLDAFIPQGQSTFQPADILRVASSVIETELLPLILSSKGDFFLTSSILSIDANGYARIPNRAVGNGIAEVRVASTKVVISDVQTIGQKLYFPTTPTGSVVEVFYYLRPGKLTTTYGTITAIDALTNTVNLSAIPSGFTTARKYDLIRAEGGYEALAIDLTSSSIDSGTNQMTFAVLPIDLQVGDYVVFQDTSPVPQLPVEFFGLLSHLTAIKLFQSNGDYEAASVLENKTKELKDNALTLICPRVSKSGQAIVRPF
jgi:hypothetical protein